MRVKIKKGESVTIKLTNLDDVQLIEPPKWQILQGKGTIQPLPGQKIAEIRQVDDFMIFNVVATYKVLGRPTPNIIITEIEVIAEDPEYPFEIEVEVVK